MRLIFDYLLSTTKTDQGMEYETDWEMAGTRYFQTDIQSTPLVNRLSIVPWKLFVLSQVADLYLHKNCHPATHLNNRFIYISALFARNETG